MAGREDAIADRLPGRSRRALRRTGHPRRRALGRVLDDFGRLARRELPKAVHGSAADGAEAMVARDNNPFGLSANAIAPLEEPAATDPDAWSAAYQSPDHGRIERMLGRTVLKRGRPEIDIDLALLGLDRPEDAGPEMLREAIAPPRTGESA